MFSKSMSTSASITQCVSAPYISMSTNYLIKSCSLRNSGAAESLIDVHHISYALQIPPFSICFNMSRNEQIFKLFILDGQLKQAKVDLTFFSLHRLFFQGQIKKVPISHTKCFSTDAPSNFRIEDMAIQMNRCWHRLAKIHLTLD